MGSIGHRGSRLHGPSATILVVDDEPMIGKLVSRALQARAVTTATSAREALAQIDDGARFDLIFCDLMIPEMTGTALHVATLRTMADARAPLAGR